MTDGPHARERIGYRRSAALPGVEVLDADHSPRAWREVSDGFAVTFIKTWRGQVYYRGRSHAVEPGVAFCNHHGEAFAATPNAGTVGSFHVLIVKPETLTEWLSEYQPNAVSPHWRVVTERISGQLTKAFHGFFASFEPEASSLQVQSAAAALSDLLIRELLTDSRTDPLHEGPALRGTARMRECLLEEGFDIDLQTLAQRAGLSRFQALRAFKRRYGLPPHAYQLCVRVQRAKGMLRDGAAPADVAAHCGFVDQSHFIRHFKRIVGVTPTRYAAVAVSHRSSGVYRVSQPVSADASLVLTRSDRRRL